MVKNNFEGLNVRYIVLKLENRENIKTKIEQTTNYIDQNNIVNHNKNNFGSLNVHKSKNLAS